MMLLRNFGIHTTSYFHFQIVHNSLIQRIAAFSRWSSEQRFYCRKGTSILKNYGMAFFMFSRAHAKIELVNEEGPDISSGPSLSRAHVRFFLDQQTPVAAFTTSSEYYDTAAYRNRLYR